jgi:hypothetical protein
MHRYLSWIRIGLLGGLALSVTGVFAPSQSAFAQATPAPAPVPAEQPLPPAEPAPAAPAPEPEPSATPEAATQSATPLPEPAPAASVPVAPVVPAAIPEGQAPAAPIAPAFPPAIPNLDYGARMRIATKLQSAEDPEKMNDISQQLNADIYMSGQLHRMLKWQAGVTIAYSGALGSSNVATVAPLDVIARFEPLPEFNIYMGRMIVVADRYTPSGPWGMDEFFYPGVFLNTATTPLQKSGPDGRDLGVNIWGAPLGGHLKYYLGAYQLHDPGLNPLLSGRLQVSLLSPEPAFYQRTTYFGTRDLIEIGVGGQYQKDGSFIPAAMPGGMITMQDDHTFLAFDAIVEKVLGDSGTLSLYGSLFLHGGDFQPYEKFWFVSAGYLLPGVYGIGKIRFNVRYQRATPNTMDPNKEDTSLLDFQVSYNLVAWFARFQLGFRRGETYIPASTMAGSRLQAANQLYLGVTIADP